MAPSKEGRDSFVIERPCDRSIYAIIWRILGIKANNNNNNNIGCEVVFFLNNLGIFDCNFGYCRWLLLFSLAQLNDDRQNEEEEEENNTKNFHYWRIDELAVHLSCAVLRISFSIVHHLSISERRRGGDLSFTLSLSQSDGQCVRAYHH